MSVHYEIHDSRSNIPGCQLFRQYDREEDAVQAIYGLGFPDTYHVVKVTTESELAGVYVVPETQEFLDQMEEVRKKVQEFRRTISPDTDTTTPKD